MDNYLSLLDCFFWLFMKYDADVYIHIHIDRYIPLSSLSTYLVFYLGERCIVCISPTPLYHIPSDISTLILVIVTDSADVGTFQPGVPAFQG